MKHKRSYRAEPTVEGSKALEEHETGGQIEESKIALMPLELKQILVATDFSQCSLRAVDYALGLAPRFGAKVILLHVVEPGVYPENYLTIPVPLDEANLNLVEASRERLNALAKRRPCQSTATETLVRLGRAHSEIPDTAKALGADMIILGTQGDGGLKHALLGSTAERVVRHAGCPVLTIRDQTR